MKHRIIDMFPSGFRENPVHFQALGLAFVYTTITLLQLFTFESLSGVTQGYGLPGGIVTATILAFLLPLAQITALPYLLSMRLPHRVRIISRASVLVAAFLWLVIVLWTNLSGNSHDNLGIFGATLYTPNQWWSVIFISLVTWAAWLMFAAKPARSVRK